LEITVQCISLHTLTVITTPIQLLFTSELIRVLAQSTGEMAHDICTLFKGIDDVKPTDFVTMSSTGLRGQKYNGWSKKRRTTGQTTRHLEGTSQLVTRSSRHTLKRVTS